VFAIAKCELVISSSDDACQYQGGWSQVAAKIVMKGEGGKVIAIDKNGNCC